MALIFENIYGDYVWGVLLEYIFRWNSTEWFMPHDAKWCRHTYLAQSPQLYKQMALMTDFPLVRAQPRGWLARASLDFQGLVHAPRVRVQTVRSWIGRVLKLRQYSALKIASRIVTWRSPFLYSTLLAFSTQSWAAWFFHIDRLIEECMFVLKTEKYCERLIWLSIKVTCFQRIDIFFYAIEMHCHSENASWKCIRVSHRHLFSKKDLTLR